MNIINILIPESKSLHARKWHIKEPIQKNFKFNHNKKIDVLDLTLQHVFHKRNHKDYTF